MSSGDLPPIVEPPAQPDAPVGNMPPENADPGDLWTELTRAPRPYRVVDFPRKRVRPDGVIEEYSTKIAMRPLNMEEQLVAQASADATTQQLLAQMKAQGGIHAISYPDIYKNNAAIEVLIRACRDPRDTMRAVFPSPKAVRLTFSGNEISVLGMLYGQVQHELGPIVADMSKDEMTAWLKKLREGGLRHPLARLSSAQVEALVMHSVSLLWPSQADSGLPGGPHGTGSTSSPKDGDPAIQAGSDAQSPAFDDEFRDADE